MRDGTQGAACMVRGGGGGHSAGPRLALYGLPPAVAEPVQLIAEILGWQVLEPGSLPLSGVPLADARLCLAVLPGGDGPSAAGGRAAAPAPLVVWSPDNILNELICRQGLSVMDQPPCIARVEQLLQTASRSLNRTN